MGQCPLRTGVRTLTTLLLKMYFGFATSVYKMVIFLVTNVILTPIDFGFIGSWFFCIFETM